MLMRIFDVARAETDVAKNIFRFHPPFYLAVALTSILGASTRLSVCGKRCAFYVADFETRFDN